MLKSEKSGFLCLPCWPVMSQKLWKRKLLAYDCEITRICDSLQNRKGYPRREMFRHFENESRLQLHRSLVEISYNLSLGQFQKNSIKTLLQQEFRPKHLPHFFSVFPTHP